METCLPNELEAWLFVCRCFGIGDKELNRTRERLREIAKRHGPPSGKPFDQRIYRETLKRAKAKDRQWGDPLIAIAAEAVLERIAMRFKDGKPLSAWPDFTGGQAEKLIRSLLNLYRRLLPKINTKSVPTRDALWVLVENVFVPAVFIELGQNWQRGLGTEFQGEKCWYLPIAPDGQIRKPVPHVLDCWLRVAGFRTAHGVSSALSDMEAGKAAIGKQPESWKQCVKRWLNGEPVKSLENLHELVDQFKEKVSWLDDSEVWRSRFTLAFGMQNLCDEMDNLFKDIRENASLTLAEKIRCLGEETIAHDDNKLLTNSHTFFAARLWKRRLQQEGKWDEIVAPARGPHEPNYSPEPSDKEIAEWREELDWRIKPGNWFLKFINKMAVSDGLFKRNDNSLEAHVKLEEYIFDLGVNELNRILASKQKGPTDK